MENTMTQYVTGGMPIREAIAGRINQFPNKDLYMVAGIGGLMLLAALITVCVTKSDVSLGRGLFEIKHSSVANDVAQ